MNREAPTKKTVEVDWSELPKELLGAIAFTFPDDGDDYRRFRGVCKNWREACPPPPFTIFLPGFPLKIPTFLGKPVVLITSFIYILRLPIHKPKCTSWIVQIDELNSGKLQVRHPITNNRLDIDDFPESLDFKDYSPHPFAMSYKLRVADGDDDVFESKWCNWRNYPVKTKTVLLKIGEDRVVVVLSLGQGGMLGLLGVDGQWKFTSLGYDPRFDDIEKFKGHVCAVTRYGKAFLINGADGKVIEVVSEPLSSSEVGARRKLLIEDDDELYLIARGDSEFKVFKLNEELHRWERVHSLGERILFVSYEKCFFIEADYLPVYERNCIVFPRNCFPNNSGDCFVDGDLFQGATEHLEMGMFCLDQNTFRPISSYPQMSKLFWPIPSWILSDSFSSSSSSGSDEEDEEDEDDEENEQEHEDDEENEQEDEDNEDDEENEQEDEDNEDDEENEQEDEEIEQEDEENELVAED